MSFSISYVYTVTNQASAALQKITEDTRGATAAMQDLVNASSLAAIAQNKSKGQLANVMAKANTINTGNFVNRQNASIDRINAAMTAQSAKDLGRMETMVQSSRTAKEIQGIKNIGIRNQAVWKMKEANFASQMRRQELGLRHENTLELGNIRNAHAVKIKGVEDVNKTIANNIRANVSAENQASRNKINMDKFQAGLKHKEDMIRLKEKFHLERPPRPPGSSGGRGAMFAELAVGGAIAAGLTRVFQQAAQIQSAKTTFRVLGGSPAAGQEIFEKVRSFQQIAPFTHGDTLSASRMLLGFGAANKGNIGGTLGMLGNIGAITGSDLSGLALVYGQVAQKGQLMGQDSNQFAERGISLTNLLAERMGKTTSEILSLREAGRITFRDVQDALFSLAGPGGAWGKGLAEQLKTLGGSFNYLSNQTNNFLGQFGVQMDEALGISPAMLAIGDGIKFLAENLEGFSKSYPGLSKLLYWIAAIAVGLTGLAVAMTIVRTIFVTAGLGASFKVLLGLFPAILGGLASMVRWLVIANLVNPFVGWALAIAGVVAAVAVIYNYWAEILSFIIRAGNALAFWKSGTMGERYDASEYSPEAIRRAWGADPQGKSQSKNKLDINITSNDPGKVFKTAQVSASGFQMGSVYNAV